LLDRTSDGTRFTNERDGTIPEICRRMRTYGEIHH
jgi:hypothetical protein